MDTPRGTGRVGNLFKRPSIKDDDFVTSIEKREERVVQEKRISSAVRTAAPHPAPSFARAPQQGSTTKVDGALDTPKVDFADMLEDLFPRAISEKVRNAPRRTARECSPRGIQLLSGCR